MLFQSTPPHGRRPQYLALLQPYPPDIGLPFHSTANFERKFALNREIFGC
jgi:hypothetical protein